MHRPLLCLAALAALLLSPLHAFAEDDATETQLAQDEPLIDLDASAKFSYALGMELAASLKDLPTTLNVKALTQGISDTLSQTTTLMTPEEAAAIKEAFIDQWKQQNEPVVKTLAEENLAAANEFLAANRNKEGVITTASGLQYQVLRQGDGAIPKATDKVIVHYRGTLLDGREFDSSYQRGSAASFPVNRVIAGWTEALQLMQVGSHYRLFLHPDLAYGQRGAGRMIGPNAALIFDVDLMNIQN